MVQPTSIANGKGIMNKPNYFELGGNIMKLYTLADLKIVISNRFFSKASNIRKGKDRLPSSVVFLRGNIELQGLYDM